MFTIIIFILPFGQYIKYIGQTAKMIQILYDYNTEYKTNRSATCYDADINSTGKTWLSLNLSIVSQVSWPNGYGGGFTTQGS